MASENTLSWATEELRAGILNSMPASHSLSFDYTIENTPRGIAILLTAYTRCFCGCGTMLPACHTYGLLSRSPNGSQLVALRPNGDVHTFAAPQDR